MELTIDTKDVLRKTDIVMVIDKSDSMSFFSRMYNTKVAAKAFVDNVLGEESKRLNKVALVSFGRDVSMDLALTDVAEQLKGKIENLTLAGGTFTQGAIYEAEKILEKSNSLNNKVIVMLTDGEPTYSYAPDFGINWKNAEDVKNGYENYKTYLKDATSSKFGQIIVFSDNIKYTLDGEKVGDGKDIEYALANVNGNRIYINHGYGALKQAKSVKNKGYKIYLIGVNIAPSFEKTMKDIAGESYFGVAADGISGAYTNIADKIATEINANNFAPAVTNAVVTDPIGEMFDIVDKNNIKVYDKNETELIGAKVKWNDPNETYTSGYFTVDLGKVSEAIAPIKIKYQVKIRPEAESDKKYPTNGKTYMEYKDYTTGTSQISDFPIPEVSITKSTSKPGHKEPDKPKPEDQKPDKPKPEEPKTEEPKLEEPKPEEPKPEEPKPEVTPEIKPEPTPVPNPTPNNPRPAYPRDNAPNPNNPDSPDEITLIDENGVPLGNYVKKTNPDGTMEYVIEEEDVPLGNMLPKTDGDGLEVYLYMLFGLSSIALGTLFIGRNARKKK